MTYTPRDIEPRLRALLKSAPCVAVTGPRQSGKTTLLRHCLPDYHYVSLDAPLVRERAQADPELFLDSIETPVILDEIQFVPELLSPIKIRVDRDRGKKGRFVFTGSQQFSLIKGLSESLAGRIALLELLPLSVPEKRRFLPHADAVELFRHAALAGSYPEPAIDRNVDPLSWYDGYLQTYLERDVRTIYNIGDLRDFQRFVRLLASRCGQQLNLAALSGDLGIAAATAKRWLSILEASRIVHLLPPYHANLGKRITKAPKVYFLDIGLACHLVGIRDASHLFDGPMGGALFENFCVQETVKFFFNRGERPPIYYLRTSNGLEVDLLVEPRLGTLVPVEIKKSRTPVPKLADGLSRFRTTFAGLGASGGVLLSLIDEAFPLTRDVLACGIDGWLKKLGGVA